MKLLELVKEKKMEFFQIKVLGVIFLIFFLNIFLTLPSILFYILIVFIVANIVLGVINKKKRIFMNIILLGLALLLFLFLIGYFATIIGAVFALTYLVRDSISFFKGKEGFAAEVKKSKK